LVLFACLFLTCVSAAVTLMLLLGHVELTKNGDAGVYSLASARSDGHAGSSGLI
jgi:hypothetical protein